MIAEDYEDEGYVDDSDAAYERYLENRFVEDPRDLIDEAADEGLEWMRSQRGEYDADTIEVFE